MFLDEAQRIKNPQSHVARVARRLNAQYRYALTGTWKIAYSSSGVFLNVSCPASLGAPGIPASSPCRLSVTAMNKRSCASSGIRPFILRRLKSEVATELPPRQADSLLRAWTGPRRLYERVRTTYRPLYCSRFPGRGWSLYVAGARGTDAPEWQVCCDPALLLPEAEAVTGRQSSIS